MPVAGVAEAGHRCLHRGALEQHILVKLRQTGTARFMAQRIGHAPDRFALGIGLVAVGEGCEQGNGEDGLLFGGVHWVGVLGLRIQFSGSFLGRRVPRHGLTERGCAGGGSASA
jgi:hypothetical protein